LRALRLPPQPGKLCIAADGDGAGMAAAQALAERAHASGWQVTIAAPPAGRDWNDVLTGRVAA
jgi:DNA primase